MSDKLESLAEHIRAAAAPLAMWYHSQIGGVTTDDSGMYKHKQTDRWNLSDSEQKKLENAYLSDGLDQLDYLIDFLERNLDDYPEYRDSHARKEETYSLVPSAAVLGSVHKLIYKRVTFDAMREALRFHETGRIQPVMQDYYDNLLGKSEDELDESDKELRTLARRALIYMATARAMLTRTVKLTAAGIEVIVSQYTVTEAENKRIEASAKQYEQSGESELAALVKELNKLAPEGYIPPAARPAPVGDDEPRGFAFF
ncbi:hypothetical protein SAMN04487996_10436 [Dyadobacter soli]|uniref:Uncharacterized protein n=2 Tax=Dyadobacter soli TaxID=659014 RepID=A0A1G7B0R4_9BACT|nr:hypothetical protein SAMN04487996_10436 [Dyadobacter soli]